MTAHSTNAAHLARGGSPACGDSSARAGSPVDGRRAASGWTAWGWTASGWGKASRGQLLAILLLGASTGACAGARHPAAYRGATEEPRLQPQEVGEAPVTPAGYALLGRVRAECTFTEGRATIEDEWLSDVDCTSWRLTEALREEAAAKGGELLVGRSCLVARRTGRKAVLRCRAGVARRETEQASPAVDPTWASLRADDPSAVEAWRIRVDFEPTVEPTARAPRRADGVDEVTVLPVAARVLGALSAHCERAPCSVEALRAGLRAAAGRLGATHVGGVRCVDTNEAPRCLAEVALLEELPPSTRAVAP